MSILPLHIWARHFTFYSPSRHYLTQDLAIFLLNTIFMHIVALALRFIDSIHTFHEIYFLSIPLVKKRYRKLKSLHIFEPHRVLAGSPRNND